MTQAIRDFNFHVERQGIRKAVGLAIVDEKRFKGRVILDSGACSFADDQICNLLSCIQSVWYPSDSLPQLIWYTLQCQRPSSQLVKADSFDQLLQLASTAVPKPARNWREVFPIP